MRRYITRLMEETTFTVDIYLKGYADHLPITNRTVIDVDEVGIVVDDLRRDAAAHPWSAIIGLDVRIQGD